MSTRGISANRDADRAAIVPSFSWRIRVYWEDTDAGGVVYHASYVRFLERARTEWLRARGIEQRRLREEHGVLFVVYAMDLRFLRPARLDDELEAGVMLQSRRAAALTFAQALVRAGDGDRLVEATVRAACVDAQALKPRAIPPHLLAGLL